MRGILDRGKLTADVPPAAQGFTIAAPGVSIVDLGTRFGVTAHGQATQVHVLQGSVELHGPTERPTVLRTDEAVQIDTAAGTVERIAARPEMFQVAARPPGRSRFLDRHLISSAPELSAGLWDRGVDGVVDRVGQAVGRDIAIGDFNNPEYAEVRCVLGFHLTPADRRQIGQAREIRLVLQVFSQAAAKLPIQVIALPDSTAPDERLFDAAGQLVKELSDLRPVGAQSVEVDVTAALKRAAAADRSVMMFRLQVPPGAVKDDGQINNHLLTFRHPGELARPHLMLFVPAVDHRGGDVP